MEKEQIWLQPLISEINTTVNTRMSEIQTTVDTILKKLVNPSKKPKVTENPVYSSIDNCRSLDDLFQVVPVLYLDLADNWVKCKLCTHKLPKCQFEWKEF